MTYLVKFPSYVQCKPYFLVFLDGSGNGNRSGNGSGNGRISLVNPMSS